MARRSDFTQKLLDDLRLRKERMGFLPPGQQRSSSSSSGSVTAGSKNSRWSFQGSGQAAAKNLNSKNVSGMESKTNMLLGRRNNAPAFEGGSQEIVPFGRNGSRGSTIDLSMALAMALSNSGKLQNIEILGNPSMGRKIVLHMDGNMAMPQAYQFPFLSPSQIGEVAKGVQNLNMILKACSNGFNFNRDSIEIGRELLRGAMDLEESLKMLITLQDASDYMVGSQRKQQRVKLLKGKEKDEEYLTHQGNQRSRPKFSFIREGRGAEVVDQKKKSASDSDKLRYPGTNSNGNSSRSSIQFISHCRSISGASGSANKSHELVRFISDADSSISKYNETNLVSKKVRMPNVIAKLMGLEELPAPIEAKSMRSQQLKEMSYELGEFDKDINEKEDSMIANPTKRMLKIDAQAKGMNNFRSSKNHPEVTSPASKDSLKNYVRNNGQMDVNNIDHKSETRVRKEGEPQEEIASTKQQTKGRVEYGNSLTDHINDSRVRRKDLTISREEKTARKQSKIDKIVQIDSSVKIINSDHEQKSSSIVSDANQDNIGKKEFIQIKEELVLKQQREAQVTTGVFNRLYNERNSEQVQQLKIHSSQSREGIKENSAKKKYDIKDKLQSSTVNKRVMMSKEIEKHPNETRARTQCSKESANSDKKDIMKKTGSQSKKENLKIIHNGTNMRNKSTYNHHIEKQLIEQSPNKRLPLKSNTRAEKMARSSIQATVMRKSMQIQSAQKENILTAREKVTNSRSSVEVTAQNKALDASQAMEQRSSILEELEHRWKERNKKVEGIDTCPNVNLEFNMQQKIEIISSGNLPEDNGKMEITTCDLISSEDTKNATSSNPFTRDVNIQASKDQTIQVEINVKSEKENSVHQIPERYGVTTIECVDNYSQEYSYSQEDSAQKYQETQIGFLENKEEDHSRMMQHNGNNSIAHEDRTIMEVDQQEILTKDEATLKKTLTTNQNFLTVAQALFQIKIPVGMLQAAENASPDNDAKLIIDCGNELLRRKGKREELIFSRKGSLTPSKRSIDTLIKEVNADFESLKYQNYTVRCDYDLADSLNKMIEKDIQHWHPDINCLWDFGWDSNTFVCLEKKEILTEVEKHVLNGLLNELSRDLLNVSIIIL
ncbi:hypothetical protein KFK09_014406 [Dendrobium nobile]|uniref:DUF3741 domain-containing protein n=1 Tax=Dendrobium nobile TaxID=94219 RepID=A0A8T3B310_DENNO|nr:hypothetical protein KFK09_014406 [Dendrobium nobile]